MDKLVQETVRQSKQLRPRRRDLVAKRLFLDHPAAHPNRKGPAEVAREILQQQDQILWRSGSSKVRLDALVLPYAWPVERLLLAQRQHGTTAEEHSSRRVQSPNQAGPDLGLPQCNRAARLCVPWRRCLTPLPAPAGCRWKHGGRCVLVCSPCSNPVAAACPSRVSSAQVIDVAPHARC